MNKINYPARIASTREKLIAYSVLLSPTILIAMLFILDALKEALS